MAIKKAQKPIESYEKVYEMKEDEKLAPDQYTLRFYIYLGGFLNYIFRKEPVAGNDEDNIDCMKRALEKINKHPIIWKLFFMI
ncbi:hypothetical protein SAMN02910413_1676 [Pseudobutyrivibrio sp. C4]|uniref:hypothetical protein n=1 Tax=Pseudobutyrivibrio sp. C4 TaxID=1520803 RepID=UPI0008D3F7E8|nr:hypothetical protein [Pseudobutyrivibrio sp. C4]SET05732.1 hypothetical protein SAMN02910413_1676 [Pseudobutyrivibrio sp. C4]